MIRISINFNCFNCTLTHVGGQTERLTSLEFPGAVDKNEI